MNVYPSILTDQLKKVVEQVEICKASSLVETIQVDIIDGFFVDNVTVFPSDLAEIDFENLSLDFHLMTQEPMDFVHEIRDSKEMLPVRAIIAQLEQMSFQEDYLQEVKKQGWKVGLSLDLHTPLEAIDEESWEFLDIIQVMSIEAGFQGRKFNPLSLELVSEINDQIEERGLKIEVIVDGGVKLDNINEIEDHGVDGVSVGSALWESSNFEETLRNFLN